MVARGAAWIAVWLLLLAACGKQAEAAAAPTGRFAAYAVSPDGQAAAYTLDGLSQKAADESALDQGCLRCRGRGQEGSCDGKFKSKH